MSKFDEEVILQDLLAERLLSEQLPHIFSLYPRLAQNIVILAPLKYALEQKRKYQETSHGAKVKFLLILCLLVASAMNSRAPYAALAGFPEEWRWTLAILVSVPLTFFAEWAIAVDIAITNCKRDIHKDRQQIEAEFDRARKTNNQLIAERAEAQKKVFHAVLDPYDHKQTKGAVIFSITLLVIEYSATLFFIRFQGEDGDWIIYIVPLLGILLAVLTGWYKGKTLDYADEKRQISQKFERYARQQRSENPEAIAYASKEFWILEGLTQFLLHHPNATPQEQGYKENELWYEQLRHEYYLVVKQWQAAVEVKERELHQPPSGLIHRPDRDRQIQAEISSLNKSYAQEIYRLEDEMKQRGYAKEFPKEHLSNGATSPTPSAELPTNHRSLKE